jgi:predicted Zn-dependent peptidase
LSELADIQQRADVIGRFTTQLSDPGHVNRRLAAVQALGAEAVTAAAQTWLASENRGVLVYRAEADA